MIMKKLFLTLCLCVMAVCASAQNFTVWYGMNYANINTSGVNPDSEMKFLNFGMDYTAPMTDMFDWSAGVAFTTKGCDGWDPGFIEVNADAIWNFADYGEGKVGLLAGPTLALMVLDDDMKSTNTVNLGIDVGAKVNYREFSLKLGYEFGLTNCIKDVDSKLNGFFIRLGYSF